mgnify:CR=1 FL=1
MSDVISLFFTFLNSIKREGGREKHRERQRYRERKGSKHSNDNVLQLLELCEVGERQRDTFWDRYIAKDGKPNS